MKYAYYLDTAIKYNLIDDISLIKLLVQKKGIYFVNCILDIVNKKTDILNQTIDIGIQSKNYLLLLKLYKNFRDKFLENFNKMNLYKFLNDSYYGFVKFAVLFNKRENIIPNEEIVNILLKSTNPINKKFAYEIATSLGISIDVTGFFNSIIDYFVSHFQLNQIYKNKLINEIIFNSTGNSISNVFKTIKNKKDWINALRKNNCIINIDDLNSKILNYPDIRVLNKINEL